MQIKLWIRAMRAPFFQAVMIPVLLGTAVAWYETGRFSGPLFFLAALGAVFLNAGTNLVNDYFDHKSRSDDTNKEPTPFSGGSRVIQEGLISPKKIYWGALISFGFAALIGIYLIYIRGLVILILGIIGILSGYFYSASPLKIGYRGGGELLAGLMCGPLVVLGAYYVQAQTFSRGALLVSIPIGLLIAAVLYINQFPDYEPDKFADKKNLVVIMGREKALKWFYVLLASAYLFIVLGCVFKAIPGIGIISLLTLPLALKAIKIARANYTNTKELIPAMFGTITLHLAMGLLLTAGYVVAGMFI